MSTPQNAVDDAQEGPFIRGRRYRVRHSFEAMRDSFTAGDVLLFDSSAWSRYDGITGYFFRQPDRDAFRVWDIEDGADLEIWRQLFEEFPDAIAADEL